MGIKVTPGTYTATIAKVVNGKWEDLNQSQSFDVIDLDNASFKTADEGERYAFYQQVGRLRKKVENAQRILSSLRNEIKAYADKALGLPGMDAGSYEQLHQIEKQLRKFNAILQGNRLITEKMELIPPSIYARLWNIGMGNDSSADPTYTHKEDFRIASEEYAQLATDYNDLIDSRLKPLQTKLSKAGLSTFFSDDKF